MPEQKKTPWMAGLFAGIFSSSAGDWVPMSQLRRFSSVGAWAIFFLSSSYGIFRLAESSVKCGQLDPLTFGGLWVLMFLVAVASFYVFLWIGGARFGVEKVDEEQASDSPNEDA